MQRTGQEGPLRTPQTAMDRGRDRQAAYAREEGHGGAGDRQGADPQRGIGEDSRQGRWPVDREAALRSPWNSGLIRPSLLMGEAPRLGDAVAQPQGGGEHPGPPRGGPD